MRRSRSRSFGLWYEDSIVFHRMPSKTSVSGIVVFRVTLGFFRKTTRWWGKGSFTDGISGLSRLNETDLDLVIVGLLRWSRNKELSEKISPFVLEQKVLLGNMVQYYFYDELFVYQRNLLFYK